MDTDCDEKRFLDEHRCLSLESILNAFNGPINEEQAWALCYQTVRCIQAFRRSPNFYAISEPKYLFVHKDGNVHEKTVTFTDGKRLQVTSYSSILSSLGVTLYQALDYGISEDEERNLDSSLENLIEKLASAELPASVDCDGYNSLDSKDEGIERDSPEDESDNQLSSGSMTLDKTIEMCVSHLSCLQQADSHYKAVCRALVAETLELSTFLEKIKNGTKELRKTSVVIVNEKLHERSASLDDLEVADWARLWMQVIRELRRGVELKKVDRNIGHRMEYELTPYEMLLDDIRLRRYKLNKVMVNGDIPQRVKKDAHALILEFIRSRPPLVPASKRQLPPAPPTQQTLYDLLMQSIRQEHQLKPTPPSSAKSPIHLGRVVKVEKQSAPNANENENTSLPKRRLIKPDLKLRLSNDYDEDDVVQKDIPDEGGDRSTSAVLSTNYEKNEIKPEESISLKANDSQVPVQRNSSLKKRFSFKNIKRVLRSQSFYKSSKPSVDNYDHEQEAEELSLNRNEGVETLSSLQHVKYAPNDQPNVCLSLTLEEIQHIRSVISKAELESLGLTSSLREDLEKGKLCFTCQKTRFSFFGPRSVKCRLCDRHICEHCCTKMHVPTELNAEIPIHMLSPTFASLRTKEIDLKETMSDDKDIGPLTTLCRDCKSLVHHVTENVKCNSDFRKTWPRKRNGYPGLRSSMFSRNDVKSRDTLEQKSVL